MLETSFFVESLIGLNFKVASTSAEEGEIRNKEKGKKLNFTGIVTQSEKPDKNTFKTRVFKTIEREISKWRILF